MHQSFVTTAPPPPTENSEDIHCSPAKNSAHGGDLLRVVAQLFIIVNSVGVYLHNITSLALWGTEKVTAPNISPTIPRPSRRWGGGVGAGAGQWLQMTGA